MTNKSIFVVPFGPNKWATKEIHNQNPLSIHYKKDRAVDQGEKFAKTNHSELTILKRNGLIQNRNSFGNDPFPPKG